jgi:hypothetical protein
MTLCYGQLSSSALLLTQLHVTETQRQVLRTGTRVLSVYYEASSAVDSCGVEIWAAMSADERSHSRAWAVKASWECRLRPVYLGDSLR